MPLSLVIGCFPCSENIFLVCGYCVGLSKIETLWCFYDAASYTLCLSSRITCSSFRLMLPGRCKFFLAEGYSCGTSASKLFLT